LQKKKRREIIAKKNSCNKKNPKHRVESKKRKFLKTHAKGILQKNQREIIAKRNLCDKTKHRFEKQKTQVFKNLCKRYFAKKTSL
jgi:hypothetical protein